MLLALSDRFLFFDQVRQVVLHTPAPFGDVSVIFADSTIKRFTGDDAGRIVDFLSSLCQAGKESRPAGRRVGADSR